MEEAVIEMSKRKRYNWNIEDENYELESGSAFLLGLTGFIATIALWIIAYVNVSKLNDPTVAEAIVTLSLILLVPLAIGYIASIVIAYVVTLTSIYLRYSARIKASDESKPSFSYRDGITVTFAAHSASFFGILRILGSISPSV